MEANSRYCEVSTYAQSSGYSSSTDDRALKTSEINNNDDHHEPHHKLIITITLLRVDEKVIDWVSGIFPSFEWFFADGSD